MSYDLYKQFAIHSLIPAYLKIPRYGKVLSTSTAFTKEKTIHQRQKPPTLAYRLFLVSKHRRHLNSIRILPLRVGPPHDYLAMCTVSPSLSTSFPPLSCHQTAETQLTTTYCSSLQQMFCSIGHSGPHPGCHSQLLTYIQPCVPKSGKAPKKYHSTMCFPKVLTEVWGLPPQGCKLYCGVCKRSLNITGNEGDDVGKGWRTEKGRRGWMFKRG